LLDDRFVEVKKVLPTTKTRKSDLIEQLLLKDRALASAAEGITIADALAPDRPLIYVNEGFTRLTGYTADETVGSNCRFLQGPDTDRETVRLLRESILAEEHCEVELLNYRKDGTPFWNRLSITPIRDDRGNTTHFIGVQSDITQRRRAEDSLREANASLEIANKRMRADMRAAATIQQSLLPTNVPQLDGARIGWSLLPCDELAGDILDVLAIDDRRVAFYVLDVCGHGVSAALLATTLNRWLSKMTPEFRRDPVAVMEHLNNEFQMDEDTPQFFTCCYGVLDLEEQTVSFVSAGHPPPILVRNSTVSEITASGFPVGVVETPEYEVQVVKLLKGDRIYIYSDGAIEQTGLDGQMYGLPRLMQLLLENQHMSLQSSIELTLGAVLNFALNGKKDDDISMLGIAIDEE
jgi:phosphoserine phosphatase RsbU/P